ncbi:MAG: glycoside hydrolase family 130 protein [Bacteroidales bacterium]
MLKRYELNPIITRKDIPNVDNLIIDPSSVFNPGAIKVGNTYYLILRVQTRARKTYFLLAESKNGVNFSISNKPINFIGIENYDKKIFHLYDARITHINGGYYIQFAMDTEDGCHLGLAKTDDFKSFYFIAADEIDSRNGVIFPEKIGDKFVRFERPNKVQLENGTMTGDKIWLSESDDLITWNLVSPVMNGRFHYWDELIGSGPTPIKTQKGWLHIYHGVATHFGSSNIYQAGVSLHDLNDPSVVIARSRDNILEPRETYELVGQVPNVVFPSGIIVEEFDENGFAKNNSEVKVYYGAADTSIGLATATVEELINACYQGDI